MESSVALDRNHPVPLHLQIKDSLADRIARGVFAPGGRLPSERQLCDEFAVSRATVREALRTLEHEGILRTVPGRGTFIAEPQGVVTVAVSLAGFTADLRRQGMTAASRVLDARLMVSPPADLTHRMRVRPGDEVVKIERFRLANGRPLALHTVYLQHRFCPDVLHHNLA